MPLGTYAEGAEALDGLGWIGRSHGRSPFTTQFNVAGTPAKSVPVTADTGTGLPIGMQSAAGYGRAASSASPDNLNRPPRGRAAPPTVWAGNGTGH